MFHIGLGETLCKTDPKLVYCGLFEQGEKVRVIVYAGKDISKEKSAGEIVKSISQILGGDRKSTRLNSSHSQQSRMPSSA